LTCVVARGGASVSKDEVIDGVVAGHGEASGGEAGVGDFKLLLPLNR
jgi:hypothetical protein